MTKVKRYARPATVAEALELKRGEPLGSYLAGGTCLLAGDGRDKPEYVIDLGSCLPRRVVRDSPVLCLGAGATFQELAEARGLPACLAEAVLSMVNRNTRNRATLGGNLGADKSCSSLIPLLLALGAEIEAASPSGSGLEHVELEAWLRGRAEGRRASDLILRVLVPLREGRLAAYRRWNRVSCDLSVLGAAAAFELEGQSGSAPRGRAIKDLRLALGGLGPRARRFPAIEALFEGRPLPSREEIEAAVSPLLEPIGDLRASAAFKRLRGAQLVADALHAASALQGAAEAPR
jgi:CO/xanthine dehydrogenase FAD-binding subunit